MERQYIGARYVPKFADPIEWDNLRSYEAMEIVTYLGTSYTSKKPVPTGVELNNSEYWVVTGNYNAQVEKYREETAKNREDIVLIENQIDALKANKKILIIGDSYGTTNGSMEKDITPYTTLLKQYFDNNNVGITLYYANQNGAGFGNGIFLTLLNNFKESAEIDDIIVLGGWNDLLNRYSNEVVQENQEIFSTTARKKFKNVKLYLGVLGWSYHIENTYRNNFIILNKFTYGQCTRHGFDAYLPTYGICVQETTDFFVNVNTPNGRSHPSDIGSLYIYMRLLNLIMGGNTSFTIDEQCTIKGATDITVESGYLYQYSNGFTCTTSCPSENLHFLSTSGFNINGCWGGTNTKICEFITSITGCYLFKTIEKARYKIDLNNDWKETEVEISIYEGNIYIRNIGDTLTGVKDLYIKFSSVITTPILE